MVVELLNRYITRTIPREFEYCSGVTGGVCQATGANLRNPQCSFEPGSPSIRLDLLESKRGLL
jgi:hypothetical protein